MASDNKTEGTYYKAFTWLLTITLACFGWFGKATYDRLGKMDEKLEQLLVQSATYKTEIENLKEQLKRVQSISFLSIDSTEKDKKGKINDIICSFAILPSQTNNSDNSKKRQQKLL